jgi:lipopolysaccharide/colanic/teichoic acid biosynthesis glycosyltransferase
VDQADVDLTTVPDADEVALAAAATDWHQALPTRADSWQWRAEQAAKRGLDIVAAGSGLLLLLPLFTLIGVLVIVTSPGPVLYEWRVVGQRGRRFTGYKFRTMVSDADELRDRLGRQNEMSGPVFKMRSDPRVTPIGRILRRYSFDELPQLWSVLVGDMSLVGPRPMFPREFCGCSPVHRQKLTLRPGITCLWQVSGRSNISNFDDWVRLDVEYTRSWSLWLDLRILLRTLPAVLRGSGAF